jgi:hypothetical protein
VVTAQGVVVDAELREGGRNFAVTPGKFSFAEYQCLRFLTQAVAFVEFLGSEQAAAEQGDGAEGEQPVADLRNVVIVAVVFGGKLLAGRVGGQQVQVIAARCCCPLGRVLRSSLRAAWWLSRISKLRLPLESWQCWRIAEMACGWARI